MPVFILDSDDRRTAESDLPGYLSQALRREHPEWINAQGECPPCEEYEAKIRHLFPPSDTSSPTLTKT